MRWSEINFVGGAYADDAKPWSHQDTLNWIPVMAERPGGRSPAMLRNAPGLQAFANLSPFPVRGLHDVEGQLLAVTGNNLVRVRGDGTSMDLGMIPGVGRVSMAHNQIAGGNQVVIVNGQNGYVFDTTTDALTRITDEGFPGAKVVDFVDGYIVGVEPFGRFWFHSDLADATSYNTLDRAEAESNPDRIVTLIVSHRDVMVLNEKSCEFFYNTGAATGTFQRRDGTELEIGCASAHSVVRIDNSVCWLGNDGCFYRLNGYQAVRISTHAIEQAVSRTTLRAAFAFTYEDRGHKIVYWTFPDGQTWGYDVATGEWHRRASKGLERWRLNALVRSNGAWIGGDFRSGLLYTVEWGLSTEAGEEIERRRTTGVLADAGNRVTVNALRLDVDTQPDVDAPNPIPDGPNYSIDILGDFLPGLVGEAYEASFTATGGHAPYTWSCTGLPANLSMATTSDVTGIPAAAGVSSVTITVVDRYGVRASEVRTLPVLAKPNWVGVNGTGQIFVVPEGTEWDEMTTHDAGFSPKSLISDGRRIVAWQPNVVNLSYSDDIGATWEHFPTEAAPGFELGYASGVWLKVWNTTAEGIRRSTNGRDWAKVSDFRGTNVCAMPNLAITYFAGSSSEDTVNVATGNFTAWSHGANPFEGYPSAVRMATDGEVIAIAGVDGEDLKFATTSDGTAWTVETLPAPTGTTTPAKLAFVGDGWVLAMANGEIYYKHDGDDWAKSAYVMPDNASWIAYDGEQIVAVGGEVARSIDGGETWTPDEDAPSTFTAYIPLRRPIYRS